MAMNLAASQGDAEGFTTLYNRQQEKLRGNRTASSQYYARSESMLTTLTIKLAKEPDWDTLFGLLDQHLKAKSDDYAAVPAYQRSRNARQYANRDYIHVQVQDDDGNSNHQQLDYPLPDEYFNQQGIGYLYNLFELCKRKDKIAELFSRLKAREQSTAGTDRVFSGLVLSHMHWWNDDKASAIVALSQAAEAVPGDLSLRLRLAELFHKEGNTADALALVDSVEPSDHNVLRTREIMALQLSVLTGDIARARKAAVRPAAGRQSAGAVGRADAPARHARHG